MSSDNMYCIYLFVQGKYILFHKEADRCVTVA